MNILHVLSQVELTGAEVYAAHLAELQASSDTVFVVSDTLYVKVKGTHISLPISDRTYRQRLRNIRSLRAIIKEHNIQLVHAHSRAASWVSTFAVRPFGIPLVSTVHGRQHLHASTTLFSVYGDHVITVSETLRRHLVDEVRLKKEDVSVIPNGFHVDRFRRGPRNRSFSSLIRRPVRGPVVLFAGRLTGPKGDVAAALISDILPRLQHRVDCSVCIVPGTIVPASFADLVADVNRKFREPRVHLLRTTPDLTAYLRAADVTVCSGRVAIESLLAGTETIAFGESEYFGRVSSKNLEAAIASNFGDTGKQQPHDPQHIADDIMRSLKRPLSKRQDSMIVSRIRDTYDIRIIERSVRSVYEKVLIAKACPPIPVLMYHRIVERAPEDSRHGLWVIARDFDKQIESLHHRGYTTITFADLQHWLQGRRSLPEKPVMLTFDDGYLDNYTTAFPILARHHATAVINIVTHRTRRTNFWDRDEPVLPLLQPSQLRELAAYGIECAAHTHSHPDLTAVPDGTIRRELRLSKDMLEQSLGRPVISVAYPFGRVNAAVKQIAREEGFVFGQAADSGPFRLERDLLEIRRTQIFPWTSMFGFWKKTQPWYVRYKALKAESRS